MCSSEINATNSNVIEYKKQAMRSSTAYSAILFTISVDDSNSYTAGLHHRDSRIVTGHLQHYHLWTLNDGVFEHSEVTTPSILNAIVSSTGI